MNAPVQANPFLSGPFAPVTSEDDFELAVAGDLPGSLRGTFYRNGPNPQFAPRDSRHHWFLGDGMVHAFRIADGRVHYRNRWVRTPKWQAEHAAGRALWGSWGDPTTTHPSVLGKDGGVANTNVVSHAGKLLALEEAHGPFALDPDSLAPIGYDDLGGVTGPFTAHPKIDPETGEMVFFGYAAGRLPLSKRMSVGVVGADGRLLRQHFFDAPYCAMVHDFLVTRNHILLPILPLTGSLGRVMSRRPAFLWEPDKGAFLGVMGRDAEPRGIRWYELDPVYVFHVMNAWEDGGQIQADVMEYGSPPLFPRADGAPAGAPAPHLTRWTLDLDGVSRTVRRARLDDLPGEFPRIDERRAGLPHRHGWYSARTGAGLDILADTIVHWDARTGARQLYVFGPGELVSEPVFAPRDGAAAEGDGVVLAVVHREARQNAALVVFDAQDVAAGPRAVAELPRRMPLGFHGGWRPA